VEITEDLVGMGGKPTAIGLTVKVEAQVRSMRYYGSGVSISSEELIPVGGMKVN
jgi:hypothetical protein